MVIAVAVVVFVVVDGARYVDGVVVGYGVVGVVCVRWRGGVCVVGICGGCVG